MLRTDLFDLVWSKPVSAVAADFGLSDRGLAKLCTRHNIPLPERGYWAKVKAGQYPARMPLPRPDQNYEIDLKVRSNEKTSSTANLEEAMQKLIFGGVRPSSATALLGTQELATQSEPGELPIRTNATSTETLGSNAASANVATVEQLLDAECERAMAAGMEYQRRQAAQALLAAVVTNAYCLEEPTSSFVLNWARNVHSKLSQVDPVGALINEIRAAVPTSGGAPGKTP